MTAPALQRCPRCSGSLLLIEENEGPERRCLQCGFTLLTEQVRAFVASVLLADALTRQTKQAVRRPSIDRRPERAGSRLVYCSEHFTYHCPRCAQTAAQ